MHRSRHFARKTVRALFWFLCSLLPIQLGVFSAPANLLWSPINGSSFPQLTVPGKVVLAWQLPGPNLIQNASFDDSPTNGWTIETSERMSWRWNGTGGTANRYLSFNVGSTQLRQFGSLSQVVTIPQHAESAIVSWRELRVGFLNPVTMRLEVRTLENVVLASQPANTDSTTSMANSADLSRFAGQTIKIVFVVEGQSGASIGLDDIRVAISPLTGAEFDVYLGLTATLNASHLIGQTTELLWDVTDRVQRGVNYWRVDVRSRGQVTRGTVWSFSHTTQALAPSELFLRNPMPAPAVGENIPLDAILTDDRGALAIQKTTSPVVLDAGLAVDKIRPASICITEVQFGNTNAVEFMNVSGTEVDLSGWKIILYVSESASGTITNTLPAGTRVPAGEIFLLLPGSPAPGTYPLLRTGRSNSQGVPQAVALFDAAGTTVDFVHLLPRSFTITKPTEMWVAPAQSVGNWIGEPAFAPEANRSLLRIGASDRNDRLDWQSASSSLGETNTGLVFPFSPGVGILSGSHTRLTNANATSWIGTLSTTEATTNAFLVARYQAFHARQGPFDITSLPRAELVLPAQIAENATEALTGSLRLRTAMSNDVRARLVPDQPSRLVLPEEVLIPGGSIEGTFQFSAANNAELSGPTQVRISVESEHIHASAWILVLDDEKPVLTLHTPSDLDENGNAQARVELQAPLSFDLQLQLSSDFTPVLVHPHSVTILAGQTSATFNLYSPEDPYFSGSKEVTLRVGVAGWPPVERVITIADNEPKTLLVTTTASRYPESFYQVDALTIALGGVAAMDIPLTIHSTDRTELAPATNAVIRAGSSRVVLPFHLLGDDLKDGTQPVTLTVSSPGFEPVSLALEITDDDPASFEIGVPSATRYQGVPFTVGFRPLDINGVYITSFSGSASLTASNTIGRVTLSPAETGPFAPWGATVEATIGQPGEKFWITAEANGAIGVSAPFRLLPSPLYKTLALAACDLRLTSNRSNLVASTSESDSALPNRILIIDPNTTEISRTIPTRRLVGRDKPESLGVDGQLALSSDGGSIFIITENGTIVQQFAWQDGALVREFGLGTNEFGEIKFAGTIQDVPGQADQVAIGQVDGWNARSTRIYDRGTLLPGTAPFGSRMMLQSVPEWSYLSAYGSLSRVSLGEAGFGTAELLPRPGDTPFWEGGDTQLRNGLIHFTTGLIYDPGTGRYVDSYPLHRSHYPRDFIGTFDFDENNKRAFFITPRANGGQMLDLFDSRTRQWIRRIELGMIPGYVGRLYYLSNALVAMDSSGIYFLRSSMFEPVGIPVSVLLSRQATNSVVIAGKDFTYSLSITNQGTNAATEITLDETLPAGLSLLSAQPEQGRWEKNERGLRWILDDLPSGASANLHITIKPGHGGIFTVDSSLATYEWNSSTQQMLRAELNVQLGLSQNSYSYFPIGARSIAYDKTRGLVYASTIQASGPFAEKIIEIEPASGQIVGSFEAGPLPYLIAVSDQDQFLWVVAEDRRTVRRYSLPQKTKDLEFKLRTHDPTPTFSSPIYDTAIAIEPVPGRPRSLAILQLRIYEGTGTSGGGIAIYDDNVLRPLVGLETGEFVTANQLLFHNSEPVIFGNVPWNGTVEVFDLTAQGVVIRQRIPSFKSLGHPGLAINGSEVIAGDGAVLRAPDFALTGYITNSAGQNMITAGAGTVTLHPHNRLSFVTSGKIWFADLSSRLELGALDLPLGQDYAVDTAAIDDQLVFLLSGGGIYFVRSEHLAPVQPTSPFITIVASGALTIRAESRPGLKYQLQSASTLPGAWTNLGDPKTGTGAEMEFTAGEPGGSQKFFRLKIE